MQVFSSNKGVRGSFRVGGVLGFCGFVFVLKGFRVHGLGLLSSLRVR